MSRVTDLTLDRVTLRFHRPVRHGARMLATQDVGVVRMCTNDGLVGLGEVAGPTLASDSEAAVELQRRDLVGMDPTDILEVQGPLRGAIDTATLDLMGQIQGLSMADLLGGHGASVAVNALLLLSGEPATDAAAAHDLVARGYTTIKLKPTLDGAGVDRSLRAIREVVGGGVALRLDLNGQLGEADAIRWLGTLEPLGLEYVEQPIAPSLGVAALARVRGSIPMPLAADESVADADAAVALLDVGACDVLVVKPSRVGGPRASVRIAHGAAAAGVTVTISTLYDSGIGLAAALHVAATIPNDRAHGLSTGELLASDLIRATLDVVEGRMALPAGSGLGITLDQRAAVWART